MCKNPAAITAILYRGEQKMHIRSNPPIERIAIIAKVLRRRVLDHVRIWKPGAEDGISATFRFVHVAQDELACSGSNAVGANDDVANDLFAILKHDSRLLVVFEILFDSSSEMDGDA